MNTFIILLQFLIAENDSEITVNKLLSDTMICSFKTLLAELITLDFKLLNTATIIHSSVQ